MKRFRFLIWPVIFVTAVALSFWLLEPGGDWLFWLRSTRRWLHGDVLYSVRAPLFQAPYLVLIMSPFTLFAPRLGQAIFNGLSMTATAWAIYAITGKRWAPVYVLALANVWTLNLLVAPNWEGLMIFGMALAWWGVQEGRGWALVVGLTLAGIKPLNVILPSVVLAREAVKRRGWRWSLYGAGGVVGVVLATFLVWGFWPARFVWLARHPGFLDVRGLGMGVNGPANFMMWWYGPVVGAMTGGVAALGTLMPRGNVEKEFANSFIFNLLLSPYVMVYHFVLATPALVWLITDWTVAGVVLVLISVLWTLGIVPVWFFPLAWGVVAIVWEKRKR